MKHKIIMPLIALAAAAALFCGYQVLVRNAKDTQPPVITVEDGLLEVSVSDPQEMLLQGVSAVDQRDGDVTASVLIERIYGIDEQNQTNVVYAAFDKAGNVSKVERKVRYKDYESPRFYLKNALRFREGQNFDVVEHLEAKDVIEGDISRRIRAAMVSNSGSVTGTGRHVLRFQVTNSLGDTVEIDLPVVVQEAAVYTAEVKLTEYLIYLERGAEFDPERYLDQFLVLNNEYGLRYRIPEEISCRISNPVNTQVPGVYEVVYTLSKDINLMTYSAQTSLIVVVQE